MLRFPFLSAAALAATLLSTTPAVAQDGPLPQSNDTVAKPRKPNSDSNPANPDDAPIPSKLSPKNKTPGDDASANFEVNTNLVTVDVSVLDNRGHFIPNIPRGNFRILEDNVPQQVKSFNLGEAPMTVCLLIEFSNKFQWYGSPAWQQTLTAAYGFVETLKRDDYVAVIAYDMHPEILSDFSQDRMKTQQALSRLRIAGFSEGQSVRRPGRYPGTHERH